MTNDQMADLTIRFAVIEQLTLELATFMARMTEDPQGSAVDLAEDLRERFAPAPDDNATMKQFKERAHEHVGLLEQRLRRLLGR